MAFLQNQIVRHQIPQQVTGIVDNGLLGSVVFFGYTSYNTGSPVNNTGTVYVGNSSGFLPFPLTSGSFFNWDAPGNAKENLNNFWIKGSLNDGVGIVYY